MWFCAGEKLSRVKAEAQFCAIMPLDPKQYERRPFIKEEQKLFEPIEELLNVGGFLYRFERANDLWCKCRCYWNEYSTNMIQYDNTQCTIEWFHKRCVGLDEEDEPKQWICP